MTNPHVPSRAGSLALSVCLLALSLPAPGNAQGAADDLQRRIASYRALVDAETNKSALCKSYVGKMVAPTPFNVLVDRLQSGAASASPFVAQVPVQREDVSFSPKGYVSIAAGAFTTGQWSPDPSANVRTDVALAAHAGELPDWSKRLKVPLAPAERPLGSYSARNVLGTPVRVAEVERHTRGLALQASRLFAFASGDDDATVMGFDTHAPSAARTVRLALVVQPQAPFVVVGTNEGERPTAQRPVAYTERATILVGAARCALALDPSNRVLASADAGAN